MLLGDEKVDKDREDEDEEEEEVEEEEEEEEETLKKDLRTEEKANMFCSRSEIQSS